MASLIQAYDNGTLKELQESEPERMTLAEAAAVLEVRADDHDECHTDEEDEGEGWCDHCNNMGILNCYCGGDLCVCSRNGEYECPHCYY